MEKYLSENNLNSDSRYHPELFSGVDKTLNEISDILERSGK